MQNDLRETQVVGRSTREWIVHRRECLTLGSLGIQYVGITQARRGFSFCRLAPSIAVVFEAFLGQGLVWSAGSWRKCKAGDVYLAPVAQAHAYRAGEGQWHLAWAAYELSRGNELIRESQARLRPGSARGLRDAIEGLYREVHGLKEPAALHHWAELVDLTARRLVQERHVDERLLRLWAGIDTELGKPWTLEALTRRVHLGPEQLRHLCQRYFGRSAMEHLAWLRMKRAAFLLEHTDQKISTVAGEVGYQNAFAFSTAFRRVMGASPKTFARRAAPMDRPTPQAALRRR